VKYFSLVIVSLAIHLLLGWGADFFGDLSHSDRPNIVEISIPENPNSQIEKQIVRETDRPNKKPKYDLKPRFFSETTKYTDQEMRAYKSGLTKNRGNNIRSPGAQIAKKYELEKGIGPARKPLMPPAPMEGAGGLTTPGVSTVGENLPKDIKVGSWTSLNTERYLFYTFFARIEERVRFHWERGVREAAEFVPPKKLVSNEWTTEIEVILNEKGDFEKVILHKKSGIDGFDRAAITAFQIGSPYLNPPQELIQQDKKLHLKYQITVFYAPPNARM